MQKQILIKALRPRKGEPGEINSTEAFHFSIGSVLGDGSINQRDWNLEIEQKSIRFSAWKRKLCIKYGLVIDNLTSQDLLNRSNLRKKNLIKGGFSILNSMPFTMKVHERFKDGKKSVFRGFSFNTRAMFREWLPIFYKQSEKDANKRRKTIPTNISDYFWGDLALAIFFLDDGWIQWDRKTACLACGELTMAECLIMKDCFKKNFNFDVNIYEENGVPHHFYVTPATYPEFYKRVEPTILEFLKEFPTYPASSAMKNKVLLKP